MFKKNLSFHPYFGASIDFVLGLIFWWWMHVISNAWVFGLWIFFRVLLWVLLIWLVSYVPGLKRWQHFVSLCLFLLGAISFFLFIEWPFAWNFIGLAFAFIPAVSFWLLPSSPAQPVFVAKPYRRWRLLMSTFGLLGLWTGGFAIAVLQVFTFNTPLFIFFATIITTLVTAWWLLEYGIEISRVFWLWLIAIAAIILEFSIVLFLWPSGYFVNGFLLVWLWYVVWIMTRFHLSSSGINWKKQIYFFASNGILLFLFLLLIVRWR